MFLSGKVLRGAAIGCLLLTGITVAGSLKSDTVKTVAAKSASTGTAPETLVVIARLAEIPGKFPPNDLYDYVYIMKYRVLKVEKGNFSGQDLIVGHYNPLIARKKIVDKMDPLVDGNVEKFAVGAKHRLTLISPVERVWDGPVEDEYIDVDAAKYFALKAEVQP